MTDGTSGSKDGTPSKTFSTGDALLEGRVAGLDRTDSTLLLAYVLGRPRTWVIAHDDAPLSEPEAAVWRETVRRRLDGEPVAYILGSKDFYGLELDVTAAVLVPRPETELLVDLAIAHCRSQGNRSPSIVDLGTGSGAIALACKAALPDAHVYASDISEAALAIARRNANRLGLEITFRLGSWWEPWVGERFDVALGNPPYVAAGDPHLEALRHEPLTALVAEENGLAALRSIVQPAPDHLRDGGWIWVEHGFEQASAVAKFLRAATFSRIETHTDLAGKPRCTGGVIEHEVDGP